MIRVEQRASTVLYKFLVSNCQGYHFLIPANVCSIVPLTFLKAGIDFSFIDIDLTTHAGSFNEYIRSIRLCISKNIGIFFVNAYGAHQDTKEFYKKIKLLAPKSIIIEDNCLCIPETQRELPLDNVELEFYSTGYSKYVHMPIGGGFGLIRDGLHYNDFIECFNVDGYSEQQNKIKVCRKSEELFVYNENNWLPSQSVISEDYTIEDYINEVRQMVIKSREHKQVINDLYNHTLPEDIKVGMDYNNWRYMLLFPTQSIRDKIMEALFDAQLFASPHYQSAAYLFKRVRCPNTEYEAKRLLNLFNEKRYTKSMAIKTADIINKVYYSYDK